MKRLLLFSLILFSFSIHSVEPAAPAQDVEPVVMLQKLCDSLGLIKTSPRRHMTYVSFACYAVCIGSLLLKVTPDTQVVPIVSGISATIFGFFSIIQEYMHDRRHMNHMQKVVDGLTNRLTGISTLCRAEIEKGRA